MIKKMAWLGVSAALVVALVLGGVWAYGRLAGPAEAQTPEAPVGRSATETITVVGQGSTRIEPDIAQVSIGVETSAETVSDAVAENESRMQSILEALEALGVEAEDIQTMNYSIQLNRSEGIPLPAGEESPERAPRYMVTNMANVTIRDLDTVGDVLDAVVEAGANSIWGVSFSLDDPAEAQAQARVEAIADAQARAEALAELTGVTLGPVMSVSEVTGVGILSPVMERAAVMGGGSISPGQVEIGYSVQVSYFIER